MIWLFIYLIVGMLHIHFGWNKFYDSTKEFMREKPTATLIAAALFWPYIWYLVARDS